MYDIHSMARIQWTRLMVEQSNPLLNKDNTQLLSCVKDGPVVLATTRSGDVLRARTSGTEHVVDEGELLTMISTGKIK